MSEPTHISVRNACEHNLRGVDVEIPRNALTVFTGVSGSGKSSLAHDTLYKEGQRRFMESLSAYARQFLGRMERPKVDLVEGISPTLAIDQKTVNRNPRSTVGTVTEIYDHLRLLMARLGTPHCPECGTEVSRVGVDQVVDDLLERALGHKLQVLAPIVQARKGEYRKEQEQLFRDGWVRARIDGEIVRLGEPVPLARYEKHTIEVVIDRFVPRTSDRPRLVEAVQTALSLSENVVVALIGEDELTFSTERSCIQHPDVSIPELEPRLFSFNAPQGACEACRGLGKLVRFDVDKLVDFSKPGAACFNAFNSEGRLPFAHFDKAALRAVVKRLKAPARRPVEDWSDADRSRLLFGDPDLTYRVVVDRNGRDEVRERPWRGLVGMVERIWRYTHYAGLEPFRVSQPCFACSGKRLNAVALHVRFREQTIHDLATMAVRDAWAFFEGLRLTGSEEEVGALLVKELRERLTFLHEVGLDYLTLDRSAATLSGGEAQRIRLAAQVGSALQGVTYVLDEPSIGLHPRDNLRLLGAIKRLRDRGNTVLVVEHDAETILASDYVVDVGPGAGREGGHLVAATTPGRFLRTRSLTAEYLRGDREIPVPTRRPIGGPCIGITGAHLHNLCGIDVQIPLGALTVVTGVSGSGKSTLTFRVLEASLRAETAVGCAAVTGAAQIDKLIRIAQTPIGRTPRSNPATYTGVFDPIRTLFAQTPEARARGYKKGRFSFNVRGGRCEACEGAGAITVEMQFLPDVQVACEVCGGSRFNAETLEITFKGATIADVLQMTIAEAVGFFANQPKIARILTVMNEVGLGYVSLGQPATTLSGGEAQRVKLATELRRPATGKTLYLLDEPTTGLHFHDVVKLLSALQRLVDAGNTVVVVEHHTDVIKSADVLVDLGPEGGDEGGTLVGWGTPEEIAQLDTPTGRSLAMLPELQGHAAEPAVAPKRRRRKKGSGSLKIEGARKHNLRRIDVEIPHNTLTVITGPSGSGKSSLAFHTIFTEGQRQYVDSLSTYARRFLGRLDRAPVDRISGLKPAIAIDQRNSSSSPRSTVATVTEIHDVLRVLWARIGVPHCPHCGREVLGYSPSEGAQALRALPGRGWLLCALRPSEAPEERRDTLLADGWTRLYADGEVPLASDQATPLLAQGAMLVLDRIRPSRTAASRLAESIERGYAMGAGRVVFRPRDPVVLDGCTLHADHVLTAHPSCPEHGVVHGGDLTPRHFSFNSRLGACVRCEGLGQARALVREKLFPHLEEGIWDAIDGRVGAVLSRSPRNRALIRAVLGHFGQTEETPVADWPREVMTAVVDGVEGSFSLSWKQSWGTMKRQVTEERAWPGLESLLAGWSSDLSWLTAESVCKRCGGGRLEPALLNVRIGGEGIHAFCGHPVDVALARVQAWSLQGARAEIAERARHELVQRLSFLVDVGLGYLTLDRTARTLSGGESQRIRLAKQLGSRLTGVVYVLDEPTIGLHPRDTDRLLDTLEGLRALGNTLVVVEHDPETIRRADHVVDLGPGAGRHGGEVVASCPPDALGNVATSVTGPWLIGATRVPIRKTRRTPRSRLVLRSPRAHNLKGQTVTLPTGVWTAVSGVSGSGKSTLIMDTLAPALQQHLGRDVIPALCDGLEVGEVVNRVVIVDQSPIGSNPRSTPATYTKVLDPIRKLFAQTPGARVRGWKPGRFSFNGREGRCDVCEGRGAILVEMHFLPDVWVTCEACRGLRYAQDTLEARFKGKSIADVLAMRCDEALELFQNQRSIARKLQAMVDVGLGYMTLGQPGNTLSGGEAQRVKLAAELTSRRGHVVYILDEPTTGLHLSDVARLVQVLHALVEKGHTVITIEHHLDILLQADHIVDLGPEGGAAGGEVVGTGTPEHLAGLPTPTGVALAGVVG